MRSIKKQVDSSLGEAEIRGFYRIVQIKGSKEKERHMAGIFHSTNEMFNHLKIEKGQKPIGIYGYKV